MLKNVAPYFAPSHAYRGMFESERDPLMQICKRKFERHAAAAAARSMLCDVSNDANLHIKIFNDARQQHPQNNNNNMNHRHRLYRRDNSHITSHTLHTASEPSINSPKTKTKKKEEKNPKRIVC